MERPKAKAENGNVYSKGKGMIRDRSRMVDEIKDEKYDSDYYINNQVVPAVEGIFFSGSFCFWRKSHSFITDSITPQVS